VLHFFHSCVRVCGDGIDANIFSKSFKLNALVCKIEIGQLTGEQTLHLKKFLNGYSTSDLTLTSVGCKYYISPPGLWPVCSHYPPPCARQGRMECECEGAAWVRQGCGALWLFRPGGEGAVYRNYIPTESGQGPSHLQFTNSERSWPAPCGNILVTLSDFFWHFTKIRIQTVAELNIN
jgi:hypothetical protein